MNIKPQSRTHHAQDQYISIFLNLSQLYQLQGQVRSQYINTRPKPTMAIYQHMK